MSENKYVKLDEVLIDARQQAAGGKGHERHATDAPFEQQHTCTLQRMGLDFCRGQAAKKIIESMRLEPEAAIQELLGAINYCAAAIIVLEEKQNADRAEPKRTSR